MHLDVQGVNHENLFQELGSEDENEDRPIAVSSGMFWQSVEDLETEKAIAQREFAEKIEKTEDRTTASCGLSLGHTAKDGQSHYHPSHTSERFVDIMAMDAQRPKIKKITMKAVGRGKIVVDSGAAESVMPTAMLQQIPMEESPEGKKNMRYTSANGGHMYKSSCASEH